MPDISNFPENKAWHFSWNLIKVCSDESGTPVQCKDAVLHNGISYTGETTSSYWIRTQLVINDRSIRYSFDAEQAVKHSVNSRREYMRISSHEAYRKSWYFKNHDKYYGLYCKFYSSISNTYMTSRMENFTKWFRYIIPSHLPPL